MKSILNHLKSIYYFFSSARQSLFLDYKVDFKPRYGHGKPPHAALFDLIAENRMVYAYFLKTALEYKSVFQQIKLQSIEKDTSQPSYNNGFLPGLDMVGIYTIIASFKPRLYIEVGSGNSTKIAHKAIKDNGLRTKIISIDPMPRAEIDELADQVIRQPFENIDLEFILSLTENDILFIDNSHRILPNSDSMVFFLEVLPLLAKGVIVHLHDIYLPYDYPQLMCDRFYSEQYGLAIFLLANPKKYKTLFANYFISEDPELSSILEPLWSHPNLASVERHGCSFWMQVAQ